MFAKRHRGTKEQTEMNNTLLLLLLSCFSRVRLCDPIDGSTPGSTVLGILQARTLEWVAVSFSNAWSEKWKWSPSVVSDSSWPHGLQPTRLLHPWDFPGKSTGVGCHYLLHKLWQRIKKQRHNFADKGLSSQSCGFSSSHVEMWELDHNRRLSTEELIFWNYGAAEDFWESLGEQGDQTSQF